MTGLHRSGARVCPGEGNQSMFVRIDTEPPQDGDTLVASVPEWSGRFEVIGEGVGLMRVHNSDTRQHLAPHGWEITGYSTFEDGSFETYTLGKTDPSHDHLKCPECGV